MEITFLTDKDYEELDEKIEDLSEEVNDNVVYWEEDESVKDETVTDIVMGEVLKLEFGKTENGLLGLYYGGQLLTTVDVSDDSVTVIPCTGLTMDEESVALDASDESYLLVASATPPDCTQKVKWYTSDSSVATVDQNGNVTIKGEGTVTITARCGNYSAYCELTIANMYVEGWTITINSNWYSNSGKIGYGSNPARMRTTKVIAVEPTASYDFYFDDEQYSGTSETGYRFIVLQCDASDNVVKTHSWISERTTLTMEPTTTRIYLYFCYSDYNTTLTTTDKANVESHFKIKMVDAGSPKCTGITLNETSVVHDFANAESNEFTLVATLTPSDCTRLITWTSSNTDVATVSSSGVVTVSGNGTTVITATCGDYSATCEVTVENYVEVKIVEIASPFEWQIGIPNTSGEITADTQNMRITNTNVVYFTTPATIDMSGYSADYTYGIFNENDEYSDVVTSWTATTTQIKLPANTGIRFRLKHKNYELWTDEKISTFTASVRVYVEEGGEAYYNGAKLEVIDSPFTFGINTLNNAGEPVYNEQMLWVVSNEIVGFTKPASIDFSAYSAMYKAVLFDSDGNFESIGSAWISKDIRLEVPVDKTLRICARKNSWGTWSETDVATFTSAIKVYVEDGGEAYVVNGSDTE